MEMLMMSGLLHTHTHAEYGAMTLITFESGAHARSPACDLCKCIFHVRYHLDRGEAKRGRV